MNHISLEIEIPNNLNQISKNEIFHLILTLPHEEILITPTHNSTIHCYTISDNNLSYTIESYLDKYISKKVRYNILIYKDEDIYPSSIRINRKGKKIYTKKQTKILAL